MPETEATTTDERPSTQEAERAQVDLAVGERPSSILEPARYGFHPAQVEAIRRSVAKDCTDAELVQFLETAAFLALNPFIGQLYAAKIKGRMAVIISRDGLLAFAHKQKGFRGLTGDVVRENDEFKVSYKDGERQIEHTYKVGREDDRGAILGAWAEVERSNHRSTYFFAPISEYKREGDTPWKKQTSAMILKVAESMALRKAYSISGVVGEDEVDTRERGANLTTVPQVEFGEDEIGQRLREAVAQAETAVPGMYRPAKLAALLFDADDERRLALAEEIEEAVADAQGSNQPLEAEVVG